MNLKRITNGIQKHIDAFVRWRKSIIEYNYLENLLKIAKRTKIIDKTIVFNTVKSLRGYIDREFYLAKVLSLNGAKVIMLLDDGVLKHWETSKKRDIKYFKNPFYYFIYKSTIKKALKTYKSQNFEIKYYSDFLYDYVKYNNLNELKKYALSSTIRKFQTSILDFKDKKVKKFYKLSLENALLSRCVGEYVLKELNPDYFVTSHGIYSTWGPAYDFLKEKGIKSILFARSHVHSRDNQDVYFTDVKTQTLSRSSFWHSYKNTLVTEEMIKKINEIFDYRINLKTKDTEQYYSEKVGSYKVDKSDGYKYHIAIFPNIIWDGAIHDRHLAFSSTFDWIISTLNYLKNRKDVKIYLKFHPGEVTIYKDSAKIQDTLKNFLNLNKIENLVIIPTKTNINPYQFLKSGIDLGICYDGILALEMFYLKIPTLLGGVRGRFTIENVTYNINTKKEYFDYLNNLDKIIEDFQNNYNKYYETFIRYSFWYLYENVIKLPTVSKKNYKTIDLLELKKEDLNLNKKLLKIFN